MLSLPPWAIYLLIAVVVFMLVFVGAFLGALAGIDWEERRRIRSLQRKRADITRALDRDSQ